MLNQKPSATEVTDYLPGLRAYTSPQGIRVIELDWWASPTHTVEWENRERPRFTEKMWRREYKRDWTTPSGDPFLPEWTDIDGNATGVHMADRLMDAPVFRAYDLGARRPAAVWFQYSTKEDRVMLYREFMPHDLQTHEFRDAVRYLSNQLPFDQLPLRSKQWVEAYAAKPSGSHCPPPWFPLGTRFLDISGKEALQQQANVPKHEEAVATDIFRLGGIDLALYSLSVEGRYRVLRRLLRLYPDGWPGLVVDPQCQETLEALSGGLSYPVKSEAVPIPTKPRNDGHYVNLMDALTYGVVMVVPEEAPKEPPASRIVGYQGRKEVWSRPAEEVAPWGRTR